MPRASAAASASSGPRKRKPVSRQSCQRELAHSLFQRYLYNSLGEGERRLLHHRVAETLEALFSGHTEQIAEQLAYHYAGNSERERHYARLAGERAAAHYANAEARRYFNRALELERRHGFTLFATQRPFMHHPDRKPLHDVLTCIRQHVPLPQAGTLLLPNAERHLRQRKRPFTSGLQQVLGTTAHQLLDEGATRPNRLAHDGVHDLVGDGHAARVKLHQFPAPDLIRQRKLDGLVHPAGT